MKNTTIFALLALIVLSTAGVQSVYAHELVLDWDQPTLVSPFISGYALRDFAFINPEFNSDFVGVSEALVKDLTGFEEYTLFITYGQVSFDESVNIEHEDDFLTITSGDKTVILTQQEYYDLFSHVQGFDSNGAPSMSGFNTRDADRVQFSGAKDVVFVMSNTEIHILAGQATSSYVTVSMDGYPIDIISTGVSQDRIDNMRGQSIGIGGQVIDIPFEAYYFVDDEGHLYHNGAGYQNVWYDAEGRASQLDSEQDLVN